MWSSFLGEGACHHMLICLSGIFYSIWVGDEDLLFGFLSVEILIGYYPMYSISILLLKCPCTDSAAAVGISLYLDPSYKSLGTFAQW